jgi:hypothetical protein
MVSDLPAWGIIAHGTDVEGDITIVACDVGVVPQVIQQGLSPATSQAIIAASRHLADRLHLLGEAKK